MSNENILYGIKNSLDRGFTKICCKLSDSAVDHEIFMGCDSITGDPVIVAFGFSSSGNLVITYTNINGNPYTGTVVRCTNTTFQLSNFQWFCEGGVNQISRTDLYINSVFSSYIWQDINGDVISAPTAGNFTIGKCGTAESDSLAICYIDSGSIRRKGFIQLMKNSSGELVNTIIYDNQYQLVSGGVILADCDSNTESKQLIPISCYLIYDINGFPILQRNGWMTIRCDNLGNVLFKQMYTGDTETETFYQAFHAHPVSCPELKCYTVDGNAIIGYEVFVDITAPLFPDADFSSTNTWLFYEDGTLVLDSFGQSAFGTPRDCGCSELAQSVKICSNEIYGGDMCYCSGSTSRIATKLYSLTNGSITSQRFVDAISMATVGSTIYNCPHTCP